MSYNNYTVQNRHIETPSVVTLSLAPKDDNVPPFIPGQFVNVSLPDIANEAKSYSIANAPGDDYIALSIRMQGIFSRTLCSLSVDDTLLISEPCGFFYQEDQATPRVFIAAGIGIMPFMSMLRNERTQGIQVPTLLLYSNRSASDLPFANELAEHEHEHRCTITHFITGENASSLSGTIARHIIKDDIADAHAQYAHADFFLCGSIEFVRNMRLLSKEASVPEESIFTEAFF